MKGKGFRFRSTEVGVELAAYNKLKPGLDSAARDIRAFGSQLGTETSRTMGAASTAMTGKLALMGGVMTAAMGKLGVSSGKAFSQVEKGWAEVTTLLPYHTKKATDEIHGQLRQFAVDAGRDINDLMGASYQAISAGVQAEGLADFMQVAGDAARGGVTSMTVAVDGLTSVLNAYNHDLSKTQLISDQMFTAVRLGKTTFDQLAPAVGQVAPIAAALGVEFGQIAAALAAITSQGISTDIAATQLKNVLNELARESSKSSKSFKEIAGVSFPEFARQGGQLVDAIRMIMDRAREMGIEASDAFANIRSGAGAMALASEKSARVHEAAMQDITGATEAAAEKMEDTTAYRFEVLGARLKEVFLQIGDDVALMAENMMPVFEFMIEQFGLVAQAAQVLGGPDVWLDTDRRPMHGPMAEIWDAKQAELAKGRQAGWSTMFERAAEAAGYTSFGKMMLHAPELMQGFPEDMDFRTFRDLFQLRLDERGHKPLSGGIGARPGPGGGESFLLAGMDNDRLWTSALNEALRQRAVAFPGVTDDGSFLDALGVGYRSVYDYRADKAQAASTAMYGGAFGTAFSDAYRSGTTFSQDEAQAREQERIAAELEKVLAEEAKAAEEQARAADIQAKAADLIEDNMFKFGAISRDVYKRILEERLTEHERFTEGWASIQSVFASWEEQDAAEQKRIADELAQALAEANRDAQRAAEEQARAAAEQSRAAEAQARAAAEQARAADIIEDNMYRFGEITKTEYRQILQARLAEHEKFTAGWARVAESLERLGTSVGKFFSDLPGATEISPGVYSYAGNRVINPAKAPNTGTIPGLGVNLNDIPAGMTIAEYFAENPDVEKSFKNYHRNTRTAGTAKTTVSAPPPVAEKDEMVHIILELDGEVLAEKFVSRQEVDRGWNQIRIGRTC